MVSVKLWLACWPTPLEAVKVSVVSAARPARRRAAQHAGRGIEA